MSENIQNQLANISETLDVVDRNTSALVEQVSRWLSPNEREELMLETIDNLTAIIEAVTGYDISTEEGADALEAHLETLKAIANEGAGGSAGTEDSNGD